MSKSKTLIALARSHEKLHTSQADLIDALAEHNVMLRLPKHGESAADYLTYVSSTVIKEEDEKAYRAQLDIAVAEAADRAGVIQFEIIDANEGTIRIVETGGKKLTAVDALTMSAKSYAGKHDTAAARRPDRQTTHRGLIEALKQRTLHASRERWNTLRATAIRLRESRLAGLPDAPAKQGRGESQTNRQRIADLREATVKRLKAADRTCNYSAVDQAMKWVEQVIIAVEKKAKLPEAPKLTVAD